MLFMPLPYYAITLKVAFSDDLQALDGLVIEAELSQSLG